MALGVRSYSNTILLQNIFDPENLPDKIPELKRFAQRILTPTLKCTDADCKTTVGRVVQVIDPSTIGLIRIDNGAEITPEDVTLWISDDIYTVRVRDTSSCLIEGGFCRSCSRGYLARADDDDVVIPVGTTYTFKPSPRALQNYVAGTYSGASLGWSPVSSEPLQITPFNWNSLTNHPEMDAMCRLLRPLGMARDDYEYLFTAEDILERALLIIATYGAYGNV